MSNEAKIITGIGVLTLVIVIGAALIFGGNAPESQKTVLAAQDQQYLVRPDSYKQEVKGAKVTLVEFGDFECPACGVTHPVVKKILSDYKGKITYVFRQFPIPSHKYGKLAADAAEAAGVQGKFFEMQDKLYNNQKEWAIESKDQTFVMNKLVSYAKDLKLDVNKFKKDIESKAFDTRIQNDLADGAKLKVNATPTFFINNEIVVGGLPYDQFKSKIDSALNAK